MKKLDSDLRMDTKGRRGLSAQNLWNIHQIYWAYRQGSALQQLVEKISQGQNLSVLSKVKTREIRHYYLKATRDMGGIRWQICVD